MHKIPWQFAAVALLSAVLAYPAAGLWGIAGVLLGLAGLPSVYASLSNSALSPTKRSSFRSRPSSGGARGSQAKAKRR